MAIKAKFKCNSVVDTKYSETNTQRTVKFNAVCGKEGDNADYSKYTPSGELSMVIDKETSAYDAFQPGREYYLTFDEAPTQ